MNNLQDRDKNSDKIKFYTIGETAKMLGIATSVLRYWEKEFPQITPLKTDYGHRIYTKDQIEVIRKIKTLLYEDGMKIKGARNILLKAESKQQEDKAFVKNIKEQLNDILLYIRKEKQE